MFATITVKVEAESRQELIDTYASQFEQYRARITELKNEGAFGLPSKVDIRFMVVGGSFRVPTSEVAAEEEPQPERDNAE